MFTVGDLARLTGVTVRALHHYDELGLVVPSQRSAAGYRLYGDADILRLQQVLLFRELGLPLDEIAAVLDDPHYDPIDALRRHREVLVAKRARLDAMLVALDAAISTSNQGKTMQPDDVKTLFDGFDPEAYADEAQQRWGETDAFKESARRTKRYGKPEWEQIKREADAIYTQLAQLMTAGAVPTDPSVAEHVDAHRAHIDRWFYPCSPAMHAKLGEMYVADPRFTANIDRYGAGLAKFMRDAFAAG
jgi:MerR family transcriptional regulator, thiopeptide resistance regulator